MRQQLELFSLDRYSRAVIVYQENGRRFYWTGKEFTTLAYEAKRYLSSANAKRALYACLV